MLSVEKRRRVLVVLVPLVAYAGTLGNPFQYDDMHSIVDNPAVRSLGRIPSFFVDPGTFSGDPGIAMYRPLLVTSFALNHAVSGYESSIMTRHVSSS